jgi:ribosome biogenesis GTPase A
VVINKNKSLKIIQSLMLIVPPNYLYYFYLKTETISLFRPVTIVSVVGVYRTGKSYLLNRLMGKTKGFPLGATLQVPN